MARLAPSLWLRQCAWSEQHQQRSGDLQERPLGPCIVRQCDHHPPYPQSLAPEKVACKAEKSQSRENCSNNSRQTAVPTIGYKPAQNSPKLLFSRSSCRRGPDGTDNYHRLWKVKFYWIFRITFISSVVRYTVKLWHWYIRDHRQWYLQWALPHHQR